MLSWPVLFKGPKNIKSQLLLITLLVICLGNYTNNRTRIFKCLAIEANYYKALLFLSIVMSSRTIINLNLSLSLVFMILYF